jgi:hypothetical protein
VGGHAGQHVTIGLQTEAVRFFRQRLSGPSHEIHDQTNDQNRAEKTATVIHGFF